MAHQRFIFQGSEERCPLKEDVKVDDGFGKLAFLKKNREKHLKKVFISSKCLCFKDTNFNNFDCGVWNV